MLSLQILLILITRLLLLILIVVWTCSVVLLVVLSGAHAGRRCSLSDLSMIILVVLAPLCACIAKPSTLPCTLRLLCFLVMAVIHS